MYGIQSVAIVYSFISVLLPSSLGVHKTKHITEYWINTLSGISLYLINHQV